MKQRLTRWMVLLITPVALQAGVVPSEVLVERKGTAQPLKVVFIFTDYHR